MTTEEHHHHHHHHNGNHVMDASEFKHRSLNSIERRKTMARITKVLITVTAVFMALLVVLAYFVL